MKRYQRLRTVLGVMCLATTVWVLDQFELRDVVSGVALVHSGVDYHDPAVYNNV